MNGDTQLVMYFEERAKSLAKKNNIFSNGPLNDAKKITIEIQNEPKFNDVIKEFAKKTKSDYLIESNENAVIEIVKEEGMKKLQKSEIEEIYIPLKESLEKLLSNDKKLDENKDKIRLMSIWLSAVVTIVAIDAVIKKDKKITVKRKKDAITQP
jgi:hypothetical protein